MSDPNALFRDHVTGVAFQLSLSKNMIAMLALVASEDSPADDEKSALADRGGHWHKRRKVYQLAVGRNDTVGPANALLRRGLIWAPYEKWPGIFCLTDAGKHTFELLKLAGLIEAVGVSELVA